MEYRIIIDQSTSGTKVLLVNEDRKRSIINRIDLPHKQIYPEKGWVEHDPTEIVDNVKKGISQLFEMYQLESSSVKSISLTNQRESIVVWDQKTGKLYSNIMVWKCNRGLDICQKLIEDGYENIVNQKTGLTIDPYFSASKLKWFFNQHQFTEEQMTNLRIGTIETWVIWNLTKGKTYVSDISNACRTLLFNIREGKWDSELCHLFDVPIKNLPEVVDSVYNFGSYLNIPIVSAIADSQAALYGNGCTNIGEAKATLGTGSSILMNIGSEIKTINKNILTTIAWNENGKTTYALEGVIRSFGDILNWLRDSLNLFETFQEGSDIAFGLESNGGVYFIPALEGLGAPFWKPDVEASFVGMGRSTTKGHLVRAGFEAMAYQIRAVIDEFEKNDGIILKQLFVDGGASKNPKFMQLLSNIVQKIIIVSEIEEVSAIGTVAIVEENKTETGNRIVYTPQEDIYNQEYNEWLKIISRKIEYVDF